MWWDLCLLWHLDACDDSHCDVMMLVMMHIVTSWCTWWCTLGCHDTSGKMFKHTLGNSSIFITQSNNIKLTLKGQNIFISYRILLNNIFLLYICKIMTTELHQSPSQRKKSNTRMICANRGDLLRNINHYNISFSSHQAWDKD